MKTLIVILLGYLLGAVPTGVILVRRFKPEVNLQDVGSGSIGATNVSRVLGVKWGVLTMLLDCLKGLAPVLFARWISAPSFSVAFAGIAAFVGHVYPAYIGFRGGKGVATSLGVFLGLCPVAGSLALFIWLGASFISRTSTVGALCSALAMPILTIGTASPGPFRAPAVFTAFVLAPFVFYTHRENIRRIIRGQMQPGRK